MEVYLILVVSIAVLAAVLLRRHRGQSNIGRTNARRTAEEAGKDRWQDWY
jgi:hypothetical protein